jgi:hypothetical protein
LATEPLNPTDLLAPSAPAASPSLFKVLLAPFDCFFRPVAAARTFVAARPAAFWVTFVPLAISCAAALACIPILVEMFDSPKLGFFGVWRKINDRSGTDPILIMFAVGLFVLPVYVTLTSWLMLTRSLRSESFRAAAGRMFRAQSSLALFTLTLGMFYFTLVLLTQNRNNHWLRQFIAMYVPMNPFTAISGLLLGRWVARRIEITAGAVENDGVPATPAPRCEGCGYDLSHAPIDGLCTECGRPVAQSLTPGLTRVSSEWENVPQPTAGSWLRTSWAVLIGPRRFYETHVVRTDLHCAKRFAAMHLRYIGLFAAVWISILITAERFISDRWSGGTPARFGMNALIAVALLMAVAFGTPFGRFSTWRRSSLAWFLPALLLIAFRFPFGEEVPFARVEVFWVAALLLAATPLVCWIGHRLGSAIVSSIAIYYRFLPDYRWAEKVVLHESVFLWLYCAAWGILATSFVLFGPWMMRSPLLSWMWRGFGMPPEMFVVLSSTIALSILWARRYLIAFRAVRWSNF